MPWMGENAERKRSFLGHVICVFLNQNIILATTKLTRQNPIFDTVVNSGVWQITYKHRYIKCIIRFTVYNDRYLRTKYIINELTHNMASTLSICLCLI